MFNKHYIYTNAAAFVLVETIEHVFVPQDFDYKTYIVNFEKKWNSAQKDYIAFAPEIVLFENSGRNLVPGETYSICIYRVESSLYENQPVTKDSCLRFLKSIQNSILTGPAGLLLMKDLCPKHNWCSGSYYSFDVDEGLSVKTKENLHDYLAKEDLFYVELLVYPSNEEEKEFRFGIFDKDEKLELGTFFICFLKE